jgi:hypothetical protein
MLTLHKELSAFASVIVVGDAAPPHITTAYQNYSSDIALEIYRNNYRGNLHDALAGAHPVIRQLVGDDFFRFMARQFIAQHPSTSANLHHYGAPLAEFLSTFEPAQALVYLAGVAALEWACHVAYFADDVAPLDINKLAQIPSEQYGDLQLSIHPACCVVRSNYPIAAIWHAHQADVNDDFQLSLESGKSIALVIRNHDMVQVSELAEDYADWLQAIQNAALLGAATTDTLARYPGFDLSIALQRLVAQNILIDCTLGETS